MLKNLSSLLAGLVLFGSVQAFADDSAILNAGDAVVTGFSGVVQIIPPDPAVAASDVIDDTLIDVNGISARIKSLASPGYVWDARVWQPATIREFKAHDVGQVFGVTLDDAQAPNIYLTATSAYGLHIVTPDPSAKDHFLRLKKGRSDAIWMPGLWGTVDAKDPAGSVGGPGSIWKIDGLTGDVSLFANVTLNGKANSGAGLGNITYVSEFKQLFISDLSTGMIHRFDLNGKEVETFDHGTTGRNAAHLKPIPYDPAGALDITKKDFDSEDPETWGFTDPDRRVYALAFHEGRLFYSVVGGSQIWSVGFGKVTGNFANDAQWEIDVPKKPKNLPVTDMLFTHKGALILAQRGEIVSTYDYANFSNNGKSRTYRYWLESPQDDPATPSRWIAEPQEYAIGFGDQNRATDGGLALNYGYTRDGYIDPGQCEASLWTTADNMRQTEDSDLAKALVPGGPFFVDGLQGMPAGPVIQDPPTRNNQPPWSSYMVDLDDTNTDPVLQTNDPKRWSDQATTGWIGDLAIYHPCGSGGGAANYFGGAGYPVWYPPYDHTDDGGGCTPGVNCPPPPPPACIIPKGEFICDEKTGTWSFSLNASLIPGLSADTIKITSTSPGISVANGPVIPMGNPSTPIDIVGSLHGQPISIGICVFDKAAAESGKPFDCCKTTIALQAPSARCEKK